MVRRALDGEVQRDLEAKLARPRDESIEVGQRSQLGIRRRVAAVRATDGPHAAGITGLRRQRVVAALAVGQTDRVDRRQVHDVETERGRPLEHRLGILERGVAAGDAGAREELVPGRVARPFRVGDDVELALGRRRIAAIEMATHQRAEPFLTGRGDGVGRAITTGETTGVLAQR